MDNITANNVKTEIIGRTNSLCAICLKRVPAELVREGDDVYLQKTCPDHGDFRTIVWRGLPDYQEWRQRKKPVRPHAISTVVDRGCPFDCGLCPSHSQRICCAQIEITERCNLHCPVCFAEAGAEAAVDPPLTELLARLQKLWDDNGKCNIQLSGGEPTVRDDLPELISAAREIGFTFFQLNTNGLRLAAEPDYARSLKEAGLSTVFMQFDGVTDAVYQKLRGRDLLAVKEQAIETCRKCGLGVVLVPTLTPGVNCDQIGDIVRFAIDHMPTVRGVHFQPISYFGRYPAPPRDEDRITLPEVMRLLEQQTDGLVRVENFVASDCESALCSFHGDFICLDGKLTPVSKKDKCCCCSDDGEADSSAVLRAQHFVVERWQAAEQNSCCEQERDGWDELIYKLRNNRLSITCMVFQDAGNIDLERLKYCCVPVITEKGNIPFCSYNLTDLEGRSLYRGR